MAKLSSLVDHLSIPLEFIERRIYLIRGRKIMLDFDLADLYQVPTKRLNEAVRRNTGRFPEDFMFQLTPEEASFLRSHFATLEPGRGKYTKYAPLAFTELGVAMLSSVLNSEHAVQMNILIMRAFVRLRELFVTHKELAAKVEQLECGQKEQGALIALIVKDIQNLDKKVMKEIKKLKTSRRRKLKIGFAL